MLPSNHRKTIPTLQHTITIQTHNCCKLSYSYLQNSHFTPKPHL